MTFRPRTQNWPLSEETESLGEKLLDAAFEVHRELGPGLLESAYVECIADLLRERGHVARTEVRFPITFRGKRLAKTFKIDLVVDGRVFLEAKSVETVLPVHHAQANSYQRLAWLPLGYLMNFNVQLLKDGYHRKTLAQAENPRSS